MSRIEISTLVDITSTGILRNNRTPGSNISCQRWDYLRNQQRNWSTIVQLAGLRFQPSEIEDPKCHVNQHSVDYTFGSVFDGGNNLFVWKCCFLYESVINKELFSVIKEDFNNVPIITDLLENVFLEMPCLRISGPHTNILLNLKKE